MKCRFSLILAAMIILFAAGPVRADGPAAAVTADQIDDSIARGVKWLWTQQKDNGLFGVYDPKAPEAPWGQPRVYRLGENEVLAMAVMLYAGENPEKPEMKKALKALAEIDMTGTYVLGFRIIAFAEWYRHANEKIKPAIRAVIRADAERLIDAQHEEGHWYYAKTTFKDKTTWDFSNTQLAVLALQQAVSVGVEINPQVFVRTQDLYLSKQAADGGWNYGRPGASWEKPSYGSMTAAAVASLFLTRDVLDPGMGCPCRTGSSPVQRNQKVELALKRGVKWLADNFDATQNPKTSEAYLRLPPYWLYAVERVGIATGFKYIGTHNWYAEGAALFVGSQGADGSWTGDNAIYSPLATTSLTLLFLIKGRGPILMNKVQFDGAWDFHPHDAANLAAQVGQIKEQHINWQVINLNIPVAEMHDAPILYISAESVIKLTDEEKKKLRNFTDTGGTIFFEASCGNGPVVKWWRETCTAIWPEWELKPLDKDHALWSSDIKMVGRVTGLEGASDGMRTFMFFAPRDISCAWNTMAVAKNSPNFDLGSNLYAYTTDRSKLRSRLAVAESGLGKKYADQAVVGGAKSSLTVARIKHGGDWYVGRNYSPWPALADDAKERLKLEIKESEPLAPGTAVPAGTDVLYLSGRTGCDLGASGGKWLKDYLKAGGFLIAEAVLGDSRFEEPLKTAMTGAGLTLKPLEITDPLISGEFANGARGYNVARVAYSFHLRPERIGKPGPLLMGIYDGAQLVGVYSPFDILFSQTGYKAFGNRGYASDDSRALAFNILLAAGQRGAPAAPAAEAPAAETAKPAQ